MAVARPEVNYGNIGQCLQHVLDTRLATRQCGQTSRGDDISNTIGFCSHVRQIERRRTRAFGTDTTRTFESLWGPSVVAADWAFIKADRV
jgi:hypothetical protein